MTRYSNDVKRLLERRGTMRARDGAVIDPVIDDSTGVQWFFKYRKSTLGLYKWIAMGAQFPLISSLGGSFTPTPINTDVITGALVTAPFSGVYTQRAKGQASSSAGSTLSLRTFLDAVTLFDQWQYTFFGTGQWSFDLGAQVLREVKAQHSIQLGAQCSVLGPAIAANYLEITPKCINI